jgi:hypothetical protein
MENEIDVERHNFVEGIDYIFRTKFVDQPQKSIEEVAGFALDEVIITTCFSRCMGENFSFVAIYDSALIYVTEIKKGFVLRCRAADEPQIIPLVHRLCNPQNFF